MLVISSGVDRTSESLEVLGRPCLHGKFQKSYEGIVRPYFTIKTNKQNEQQETPQNKYLLGSLFKGL